MPPSPSCRPSWCRAPRARPTSCWKCSGAGVTWPSCWTSSAGRRAWSRSRICFATSCRRSSSRAARPLSTSPQYGSSSLREAPRPAGSRTRSGSRWRPAASRPWRGWRGGGGGGFPNPGRGSGPPGAGKSTLTEALIQRFRARHLSVGVVAVDPTSPFTGGALLGDRIRMESAGVDPGVFIRSMATRGAHGGLATTTEEVADLLEAFGFQRVLLETVGVGQTELDIARTAETTVLVLVPESGDGIQALKAGVMEIADIYVVNKSDRPGADKFQQEVEVMLGIRRGNAFRHITPHHRADRPAVEPSGDWEPPVLASVASTCAGVDEVAAALDVPYDYLPASRQLAERRRQRLAARTRAVLERRVRRSLLEGTRVEELLALRLDEVADGRRSPYDVAAEILDQVKAGEGGDAIR